MKTKYIVQQGLLAGWPICIGYIPIGLAFGVLAQKAGLYPMEIFLMSVLVFAGSSQFIAVSMLSSGAGFLAIVIATFMINLRHILMSSALAVHLNRINRGILTIFAYGVTDESFAVNLTRFQESDWSLQSALVVNHSANITWVVSSALGGVLGQFIHEKAFGIDYALIAMFLCLLVFQLKGLLYAVTAVISGVLAVLIALLVPGNVHIVIASIFSAGFAAFLRSKFKDRNDSFSINSNIPKKEVK